MREPNIALGCPPVDPDPILLEQMTMLAAASVAPGSSPWWQRVATKSGAIAIASVMALSGAAYATRGELAPIVKSMTGGTEHHAVRHHVRDLSTSGPTASTTTSPTLVSSPSAEPAPAIHGRRAHGFHAKRGKGEGWTKQNDQGNSFAHNNGNGRGHAYGREGRGNRGNSGVGSSGNSDNSQGHGQGKALGHTKTGRKSATHGNHYGWSHFLGNSQSPG